MRDVSRHRTAQPLAGQLDGLQPVVRQGDDDGVEVLLNDGPAATEAKESRGVRAVVLLCCAQTRTRALSSTSRARQALREPPRQHVHPALNRVLGAVTRHGAEELSEPVQAVGQVRLGGQVAVCCDSQVLLVAGSGTSSSISSNVRRAQGCPLSPGSNPRYQLRPGSSIAAWRRNSSIARNVRRPQYRPISLSSRRSVPFRTTALLWVGAVLRPSCLTSCAADPRRSLRSRSTPPRRPRTSPARNRNGTSGSCRRAGRRLEQCHVTPPRIRSSKYAVIRPPGPPPMMATLVMRASPQSDESRGTGPWPPPRFRERSPGVMGKHRRTASSIAGPRSRRSPAPGSTSPDSRSARSAPPSRRERQRPR